VEAFDEAMTLRIIIKIVIDMKIICIGRNYADHAKELKNEVPAEPVIFLKPDTALLRPGQDMYIPGFSNEVHYEAELVVRINRMGKHIEEKFAHKYYSQVTVGIDFTARDVQQQLREKELPWEKAKAFDSSAAIGEMVDLSALNKPVNALNFQLTQNGEIKQTGYTGDMIFPVNKIISYIFPWSY
jgi:acylpyruvate hydrolase